MRCISAFSLGLIVVTMIGTAWADKLQPNEKDWSYRPFSPVNVLPEVEPNDACPGQGMACSDEIVPAALDPAGDFDWFSFEVDETFRCVTIGTDSYQGSGTDTYLELYDACGGPILAQDDDGGPGYFSLISAFITPHPGTYYAKVRGYSPTTIGAYRLFLWCSDIPLPPPNDWCQGAYPLDRCSAGTLEGSLHNYTNDYDPGVGAPPSSCTGWSAAGLDATYRLDLETGDACHFVFTQLDADASFYIVTDCADVNGSCVIGADATFAGQPETIDWTCPAAGAYYLILDGVRDRMSEATGPSPGTSCARRPAGSAAWATSARSSRSSSARRCRANGIRSGNRAARRIRATSTRRPGRRAGAG